MRELLHDSMAGDLNPWVVGPVFQKAASVNDQGDRRWIGKLCETCSIEPTEVSHP
jgi:hypothetical protein